MLNPLLNFLNSLGATIFKVWVLSPLVETNDENIDYYYDFSQSITEYERAFALLEIDWKWQPVTMNDYAAIVNSIAEEMQAGKSFPIVLNLCDGDEINGTPGASVVRLLEEKNLLYTGANEYFYQITTSKIPMKVAFDKAKVSTAKWESVLSKEQKINDFFKKLGSPIIVKPSVSGGSMGVGIKNVVNNETELKEQIGKMFDGYRGWHLATDGLIAESFINGPEFTVFITGSHNHFEDAIVYEPVERVFHASLPAEEQFLSFDRLWEIYEEEKPMPNEENFYEYRLPPDEELREQIKKLSWDAYVATKGTGYTRVDIRMDKHTGQLYVLEVNAQCGLSEDEDYTSIGAILKVNDKSFATMLTEIIKGAYINFVAKKEWRFIEK